MNSDIFCKHTFYPLTKTKQQTVANPPCVLPPPGIGQSDLKRARTESDGDTDMLQIIIEMGFPVDQASK